MGAELVRYSFQTPELPLSDPVESEEPGWNGVHFTFPSDHADFLHERMMAWFEGREEIILVDEGDVEKTDLSFIILEWEDCEIDPLFLRILKTEDIIAAYNVYFRSAEDYD